jgi:magnesium-transporting ATPase (P-type)
MILMHNKAIEEVLKELNTSPFGLSQDEAERRLKLYGLNETKEKKESVWEILLRHYTNPLILILMVAGFLALELRKWAEWLYNRKAW